MKLKEIFDQLTYGELANIHLGGADVGMIDENNYPKILAHVNLGLTALYKRFPLKEGRLTVALQEGRFTYPLTSAYAQGNTKSLEPVKFIIDSTTSRFLNDIHKVERVYTDGGKELGLNDEADIHAISTPSATVLRVPPTIVSRSAELPEWMKTSNLEVVYRANHPILTIDDAGFDVEFTDVELPYSHLEPLLLFVASRINNPIGMVNEFNAGNNYAAKYEKSCLAIELTNLRVDQGSQSDRITRNGWV